MKRSWTPVRRALAPLVIITLSGIGCSERPRTADGAGGVAADFFISPDGRDAWSGRLPEPNAEGTDGPLATLAAARDAVRRTRDEAKRDRIVLIRGGAYRISETVVFSLEDSAAADCSITYAAFPGETPVFSAGRPVRGWRKLAEEPGADGIRSEFSEGVRDRIWIADVAGADSVRTLFDGEGRLPRASCEGFTQVNTMPRGSQDHQTVEFPFGAVPRLARPEAAELRIIPSHFWIMNLLPIASMDHDTLTLVTGAPGTYPLGKNGMEGRPTAWIENAPEVLDRPGEWIFDAARGLICLWPRTGRPGDDIVAPALTEMVRIEGRVDADGPRDVPVEGLRFRGLTFRHGDRLPWEGRTGWGLQHDWEMFDKPTAMVRFRGAERCAVEDCEFSHSGHTAVRLDLHCQRIRISGNHIHSIGGVGVLLAGYGSGTKDVNRDNEVIDNCIHHIGREYWGSTAIFAWQSGGNLIARNHIHHLPYTAILATGRIIRSTPGPAECSRTIRWSEVPETFAKDPWTAREPFLHARGNVIEANDIHNVMETLGDGNCIYVSGAGGGNVVRHNHCHDSFGDYMNAAIRCDDDQHGTLIEGNVIRRTGGYGEGVISKGDNDIINNVIADLLPNDRHRGYIVFPYGEIHGSTIERNVIYSRGRAHIMIHHSQPGSRGEPPRLSDTKTDRNLYFNTETNGWAAAHFATARTSGNDRLSLEADPMFIDLDRGDVRFKAGSPAGKLGIHPLDAGAAGPRTPACEAGRLRRLRTRIEPDRGTLAAGPIVVRVACDDPAAEIRVTLDGSEPVEDSPRYTGPITNLNRRVVRARAFVSGARDVVGATALFVPPPPPPEPILDDFESTPPGRPPAVASLSEDPKKKQYSARVTEEQAAGGRRSLKFVDGPGQTPFFAPHIFYHTRFEDGDMIGRFDMMIDAAAAFSYQWRQYDEGKYHTGPAVNILPGGRLTHLKKELAVIPRGEWVRFEVRCRLGEATGKFTMRVILPGSVAPLEFDGLACDAAFDRLDWVGFASKSEADAVYYIDNLAVEPAGAEAAPEDRAVVLEYIRTAMPLSFKESKPGDKDIVALPHPYTAPCAKDAFQLLFYWDTYFINLGLIRMDRVDMARNNADNLLLLLDTFGLVPNANRRSMANRSQIPLLSAMVRDVADATGDTEWLRSAFATLHKEYEFWMTQRIAPIGLNRSGNSANRTQLMNFYNYLAKHRFPGLNHASDDEKLAFSSHALSEAETWDFTPRFDRRAEDFCAVDLNATLYMFERDMAGFSDRLDAGEGDLWRGRAEKRKALIEVHLWNEEVGSYVDFDWKNGTPGRLVSAAALFPMMAGIPSQARAERLARTIRERLVFEHGVSTVEKNESPFVYQWDYPNAWPPMQCVAIRAFDRYGYTDDARRVAEAYVRTVARCFGKTGDLWEKYNALTGSIDVVDEYEMPRMLGWTAGVFVFADAYLRDAVASVVSSRSAR